MSLFLPTSGHPRCTMFACLTGTPTAPLKRAFEEMLSGLPERRAWVLGSPALLDSIEEAADGRELRTYGAALEMYTALPPWGARLPKEIDRRHFEETSLLVEEIRRISAEFRCEFELQLDQTYVGAIQNGVLDKLVRVGLLEEWKRMLDGAI